VITDPALLAEAMRSGQIDAVNPPFTTDLLALRGVPGLTYELAPAYALEHYDLREGSAPAAPTVTKGSSNVLLRAPWMRQAIALALNRQAMIDAVYGPGTGLKPVDNLLFFPGEEGYRPDFARWEYDPTEALALLKRHCTGGPAAPDPATTKVWQCTGLPAVFRYTWPAQAPARAAIEQVAKADLKAVGIAITERPLPSNVIFGPAGIPSGDYDLDQFAQFTSGDPGDWYDEYRCRGSQNWTGYCSHTVDTLLNAAPGRPRPGRGGLPHVLERRELATGSAEPYSEAVLACASTTSGESSISTPSIVIAPQARQKDASASGSVTQARSPHFAQASRSSSLNQASRSTFARASTSRMYGRRESLGNGPFGLRQRSPGRRGRHQTGGPEGRRHVPIKSDSARRGILRSARIGSLVQGG
jgi:Bacterial extracellular solute-binding proteins, family 5 Middle